MKRQYWVGSICKKQHSWVNAHTSWLASLWAGRPQSPAADSVPCGASLPCLVVYCGCSCCRPVEEGYRALSQTATELLGYWCQFVDTRSITVTSASFVDVFIKLGLLQAAAPPEAQSSLSARLLAQFEKFACGSTQDQVLLASVFLPLLLAGWDSGLLPAELQHFQSVGPLAAGIR